MSAGIQLRIGKLLGIPISVHWSWALGFVFITWTLANGPLPLPLGLSEAERWIFAVFITVSLFASVLMHELAHSLTAKRLGYRVTGITLLIFGGASLIQETRNRPAHDFMIAFAGPLMSLILGLAGLLLMALSSSSDGGSASVLHGWFRYMGWMNLLLAAFNMLPGVPLDGGRVLQSVIWGVSGSLETAIKATAIAGRAVALLIFLYGFYLAFVLDNLLGGLWLIFIAIFIGASATGEARKAQQFRADRESVGVSVREVMSPAPTVLDANMPLSEAVWRVFSRHPNAIAPVVHQGSVIGFLTLEETRDADAAIGSSLTVGSVTRRASSQPISSDRDVSVAAQVLQRRRVERLLVFDDQRLIGTLGGEEISEFMQRFMRNAGSS